MNINNKPTKIYTYIKEEGKRKRKDPISKIQNEKQKILKNKYIKTI